MKSEKVIGYLLLTTGIGMIFLSTFWVYQIFTGQKKAPQVVDFKMPSIKLPGQSSFETQLPESELKLLPDQPINDLANMSIYFFLMGFVASSGTKIGSLGVKMIKDVKVMVKEEKLREV